MARKYQTDEEKRNEILNALPAGNAELKKRFGKDVWKYYLAEMQGQGLIEKVTNDNYTVTWMRIEYED